jgi:alpha-beta hydrolase superfamily lysophospholipase
MDTLGTDTFTLPAPDGAQTFVRRWLPENGRAVTGTIVLAHGVSEHSGRYDRFGRALAAAGYATYASDHRGHGGTSPHHIGNAGPGGWNNILDDLHRLLEYAKAEHPGGKAFYIGHSMGSMLGQRFIALYGNELAGAVLIGVVVSFAERADLLAAVQAAVTPENRDEPSATFGAMFADFNAPFEPVVTGFEWLSRDAAEVRKYVDDPLSGNPLTNATLAEFFPGWMQAGSAETSALVPTSLPVLIVAGARDSAGGNGAAPKALEETYRSRGIADVSLLLYADARHEVLNETNRADVERDIIAWLDRH